MVFVVKLSLSISGCCCSRGLSSAQPTHEPPVVVVVFLVIITAAFCVDESANIEISFDEIALVFCSFLTVKIPLLSMEEGEVLH